MSIVPSLPPSDADYAWEVATLFPEQGHWSEAAYLDLTDSTNRRIELVEGRLEFLPMPTEIHEALVQFLFLALYRFVDALKLDKVYSNGIRVRVAEGRYRFPDVVFLHKDHFHLRHNRAWNGADLAIEVVSDDDKNRDRDYGEKLIDYALTKVAEYWIVEPARQVVTVHRLAGEQYAIHGEYSRGQEADSALLPGFAIDLATLFSVIDDVPE